jgi:hypothetical protein
MDGPCVKSVDLYPLFHDGVDDVLFTPVSRTLLQYIAKIRKEYDNHSPRSLLTFRVFAQLSHLVAMRQGVCCYYLTTSLKYALFSFLKMRQKDQTGKKIDQ